MPLRAFLLGAVVLMPMPLAAEPWRWYSTGGSPPPCTLPLNMKPVFCVASQTTCAQSTPSPAMVASK
jgi:hypothetical protein